jgi:hypothetical protein
LKFSGYGFTEVQIKAGVLEQDETWSGEILVVERVEVPEGVTLTIKPGTVVKFKHYRHGYTEPARWIGLDVDGKLIAIGTPEKPIWFTSDADDPMNGDWDKIGFYGAEDGSIIKYAIIEFTMNNGINIIHSSPTISHTIIRWGVIDELTITGKIYAVPRVTISYLPYLTEPVSKDPEPTTWPLGLKTVTLSPFLTPFIEETPGA